MRNLPVLVCASLTSLVVGCGGTNVGENETIGREGLVKFSADTKLVFSNRIVTGSSFAVTFAAVDTEETNLAGATLRSSDEEIITVGEGPSALSGLVTLAAPGAASIEVVQDGNAVKPLSPVRVLVPEEQMNEAAAQQYRSMLSEAQPKGPLVPAPEPTPQRDSRVTKPINPECPPAHATPQDRL